MKQVVQKILLLVAVFTVTAHSIIPHYHHDEISIELQDHDHEEEQAVGFNHHNQDNDHHNIFSFAQLDENFVPVNSQSNSCELPLTYLSALIVTYLSDDFPVNIKTHFGYYQVFPPPEKYFPSFSLRGPPTV